MIGFFNDAAFFQDELVFFEFLARLVSMQVLPAKLCMAVCARDVCDRVHSCHQHLALAHANEHIDHLRHKKRAARLFAKCDQFRRPILLLLKEGEMLYALFTWP